MTKLAGLDAGFLYSETPRSPTHIASIQVLDIGDREPLGFVDEVRQVYLDRLHVVPYFTRRLRQVPLQLDHPEWESVETFDINDHVKTRALPAPGDRAALEKAVADIHAQPLDRSKPLWDVWLLTGLEGGRVALYNRSHHACIDGVSGQLAVTAMMDSTEAVQPAPPVPDSFRLPAKRLSMAELLIGAAENFAQASLRQAFSAFPRAESAVRFGQRLLDPSRGLGPTWRGAPSTRFNVAVSAERSYATAELPLADVKAVAKATGATLNDVFLAMCGGGLRRYLTRHGELPEETLLAGCPVSLRKAGDTALNNQVSAMVVPLGTDIIDPIRRVQAINAGAQAAKSLLADTAEFIEFDPVMPALPALMQAGMRAAEASGLLDTPPPRVPFNLIVSNVPGPREALYLCGAKVLTHYPVSIPAHTQAINITVQSYNGGFYFAVTGCARALPDPERLRDDMLASFGRLQRMTQPEVELPLSPSSVVGAANDGDGTSGAQAA